MEKIRKRKQAEREEQPKSKSKSKSVRGGPKSVTTNDTDPYPSHTRPTPQECQALRDTLLSLHGIPPELAKYRKLQSPNDTVQSETVLDGLVRTVLSQNTTETNSQRAFASLKSSFPTWEHVLVADSKDVENAIRCGGLAPTKASCIKNLLRLLLQRRGKLCLEYLRHLSVDEIKAELSLFKGIGPKTLAICKLLYAPQNMEVIIVACVLMFNLQQDDFPVDTHIFEIAKTIGWVPAIADRNKTYLHLNQRIPTELKFDLNCLLYTHGKLCRKCTSKRGNQQLKKCNDNNSCPLLDCIKSQIEL